jgi:predicted aspartyl protease
VGTFTHPITLIGPAGQRETLEALVDTGATFTVVPAPILQRLRVKPHRTAQFANGRNRQVERWRIGEVTAELDIQQLPILCLFGPADALPLIGSHTLDTFLLAVDPVEQKLVPKESLLMTAQSTN